MINGTKKGFSLVEVMILFTVLAVLMAASLPIITKKSRPVPRKISHGVYVCYADGNQLYQELYTGTRLSEPAKPVSACNFTVPEAALYKVDLYSAGAGGYLNANIETGLDDYRTAVYSLGDVSFGQLYQFRANNFNSEATLNPQASPIHQLTDDDLNEYFRDDYLIRSEYTNNAGYGAKGTIKYFTPKESRCLAQAHLLQALNQQVTATRGIKERDNAALGQTSSDYGGVYSEIRDYITTFNSFLTGSGSGVTDKIREDMISIYTTVNSYNSSSYNNLTTTTVFKNYQDFKDKVDELKTKVKENYDNNFNDLKSRVDSLKSSASSDGADQYAKTVANNKIQTEAKAAAKSDAQGFDPSYLETGNEFARDMWAINAIKNDSEYQEKAKKSADDKIQADKLFSSEFKEKEKTLSPQEYAAFVQSKWQEYYDSAMQEYLTTTNINKKINDCRTIYTQKYNEYITKYQNDGTYKKYYDEAKTNFANGSSDALAIYKTNVAASYESLKTAWTNDGNDSKYITQMVDYNANATTIADVIKMQNEDKYAWEYQTFYGTTGKNYSTTRSTILNMATTKYITAANVESIKNCLITQTDADACTASNTIKNSISTSTIQAWANATNMTYESARTKIKEAMTAPADADKYPKPVKYMLKNWQYAAKYIYDNRTPTQIRTEKYQQKALLFENQTFSNSTPKITEANWYGTSEDPGWVMQAESYFNERKAAYNTEKEAKNQYWENELTRLGVTQQQINDGRLDLILEKVPLYWHTGRAYDLKTPWEQHNSDYSSPVEVDSNTFDQLEAYCRANNVKMFMQVYKSTLDPMIEDEKQKLIDMQNKPNNEETLAEARKAAFTEFLSKDVGGGDAANAFDSALAHTYSNYREMLQDYWNRPIQFAERDSSGVRNTNSLSQGYGGMGGMGGYLRIKYPVAYISRWVQNGSVINANYRGIEGGEAKTMLQYVNAMRSSLSPEGRYPVMCSNNNNVDMSRGYWEIPDVGPDDDGSRLIAMSDCFPFGGLAGSQGLFYASAYDHEFEQKQKYITTAAGNILRDVEADYYKDADRIGDSKYFLDKSGSNRYLKTYKGIDLNELRFPYIAWHIPVHENNPYEITKHRYVSLVKGIDKLATGGGNKLIYMSERNLGNSLPEKAPERFLSNFYTKGHFDVYDNADYILQFDTDYETPEDVSNAMLKTDGRPLDVAFSVATDPSTPGQNTKFEAIDGITVNGFPSYRITERWDDRNYTTTITAVTGHTEAEKTSALTAQEEGNTPGMIAYQDPQLKEFSKIWSKRYYLGKSGRPGKMESGVATNLGKFCHIDVPKGGKPYDITEEEGYDAITNPNPIPKPKLEEMEDRLAINMSCGKNFQEVMDGKNIVYNRTVRGGTYNLHLSEEPREFHWTSRFDMTREDEEGNMITEAMVMARIMGERYEGSKDTADSNVENHQPQWRPTSIWAKIFKQMMDDDSFAPSSHHIGRAGDGPGLDDRCTARKGVYQLQKQYARKRFIANTMTVLQTNLKNGEQVSLDLAVRNYPIRIENNPSLEIEPIQDGRYSYNGKSNFRQPNGNPVQVDCYFADDVENGAENTHITTNLTTKTDEYRYGAYKFLCDRSAGNDCQGGGGAVVITW